MTPEALAERQNAVEHAVALLLQTLTPNQRAAYVLREAFGYSYDQIGDLLHLSVTNARQQVSRAQDRLDNRRHTGSTWTRSPIGASSRRSSRPPEQAT